MEALNGDDPHWSEVRSFVSALAEQMPPDIVSVSEAPFGGQLFAVAVKRDGTRHRLDAPPRAPARRHRAHRSGAPAGRAGTGEAGSSSRTRTTTTTPSDGMWRRCPSCASGRRGEFHRLLPPPLDSVSGRLVNKIDTGGRAYRWWHSGLHQLDFTAGMRTSAFRNFPECCRCSSARRWSASTGAWLGIRRLTRSREAHHRAMARHKNSGDLNRRAVLAGLGASLAGSAGVAGGRRSATPTCVLTPVTGGARSTSTQSWCGRTSPRIVPAPGSLSRSGW